MVVRDIINAAKYSELSSTALKDNAEAIVLFLNLGLLELYKRFPLKTSEATYAIPATPTMYSLPLDFMYPLAVYGQNKDGVLDVEIKIPVNEEGPNPGVFFPNHKQIQVSSDIEGNLVSVIFVTKPESYSADNLDAEVDLPETLIEPLLHYIGYKAHLGIKSDGQSENTAHYIRFEASCNKARELGVAYQQDSYKMATRITDRGFV